MPQADMESSSGLIMSLIRIVKNSKNDAERDVIKKKLVDYLTISDEKLTKLLATHQKELKFVVENCTVIPTNLENSLKKLAIVEKRLTASNELLTLRLKELVKLSEEYEKNERILQTLDQMLESSNETAPAPVEDFDIPDSEETVESGNNYLFKFSLSSHGICLNQYYNSMTQ